MQTISVQTTQNVSIQYPIASVGDRIVAYLLDLAILIAYAIAVIAAFVNMDLDVVWPWIVFLVMPWFLYHLMFEIFMNGQSPGKRVMNIQVVRVDGTQPGVGNYLLRWVFSLIDFHILSGAIAVIAIATNGRGQRVGDVVAGTCVVKLIAQKEITASEVFISPEDTYVPVFPQVVQLASRDIELIQRALDANTNHGNMQPVLMVTDKIKSLLGVQTDLAPAQFLYTIVKDFNHLNAR
ncbi:RDD family protein [Fulvivirgaceae bacterium PWU4]|uniref:RDD family protein n=1 Tax=Chryseosolibacter histidini TaxID=2782349 RepID=A0AAP2DQW8_9BACT|nr:RDD family protein [Chryseosolibacter histidini]MBT1698684.1 RDD family protein [Chryseosolibacter histidini]